MRIFAAHLRFRALEFARVPFAIVPTLAFPVMITLFFLIPNLPADAADQGVAVVLLFSFTMLGIFIFGAGTAQERSMPWDAYLRTLPVRARTVLGANMLVGFCFALTGALPAIVLINWQLDLVLPIGRWPLLAGAVMLGAMSMSGIGLTIGYLLPPKAAIATANVLFLPMAFVGGLLGPPELLPGWAAAVGWGTPMRPWVELSMATAAGAGTHAWLWLVAALWGIALGALATWAYRRDQDRRYS